MFSVSKESSSLLLRVHFGNRQSTDLQVPIATRKLPSAPGHQKETNGLKLLRLSLVIALLY